VAVERHFIGWDTPVLEGVCRFLLSGVDLEGPADLDGTLVVVPTRQAGRRLREALARSCNAADRALVSARVVTPAFFLRSEASAAAEASATAIKAAWAILLGRVEPDEYEGVFPAGSAARDTGWAMYTGEMLQGLRNTLADGCYLIGDVVEQHGDALEEAERWSSMAALEELYLGDLARLGLRDPCELKIECAASPTLPDGVERVVVCAVPDPSLLTVRAFAGLSASVLIEVLVHAPERLSNAFDEWGRPRAEAWETCEIPVPRPDDNIVLGGSPLSQAQRVVETIAAESDSFGPADVAIGVPDRSVIPFLEADLSAHGLAAFDPADKPVCEHSLYRLVASYADLVCDRSYASVAAMLRHPDALAFLAHAFDDGDEFALSVLRELDEFQNRYLPNSLDDMLARLTEGQGGDDREVSRCAHLRGALQLVKSFVDDFDASPVEPALRACLQRIYACKTVSSHSAEDQEFAAVAAEVDKAMREVSDAPLPDLSSRQVLRLLLRRIGEQRYSAEVDEADIDLEGWLELHWNDAPLLIVTGMNEGTVPDSRLSDVFLPDSLRRTLELRDDRRRLARDSYLMRCLVESRRNGGRACFVAGKTSVSGDPLKPSRLLFRCPDKALSGRAAKLFGSVTETRENHPATVSFKLNPWTGEGQPRRREPVRDEMSVTAFRAYLACPFRYYLGRELRMEALDDAKTNLDAFDFGNLVHDALEAMGCDDSPRTCDDSARLEAFLLQRADAWVRARYGPRPSLPVLVTLEAAKQRLAAAARVQAQLAADGWEIIRTESTLACVLGGVTIKGKVDRVDRNRRTGVLRIIDYKTSDTATSPAEAHLAAVADDTPDYQQVVVAGKRRRWIDLQLPLYDLLAAADEELAGDRELAYFGLPKAVGHTGVTVWDELTADMLGSSRECAGEIVKRVCRGEFWPPAQRLRYDDFASLLPQAVDECVAPPDSAGEVAK